jgi:hypothetical protein
VNIPDAQGDLFFGSPWPDDYRDLEQIRDLPNPKSASGCAAPQDNPIFAALLSGFEPRQYRNYVKELVARSGRRARHPGVYVAFDGAIDERNLPTPQQSLNVGANVFLMNVDSRSEALGQLVPVATRVYDHSRYMPPHTLAVVPYAGFPLRPATLYALVVRRSLNDESGSPLGSPRIFERLKAPTECIGESAFAKTFDYLESEFDIPRGEIAAMTIFGTGAPTQPVREVLTDIAAIKEPASIASVTPDKPAQNFSDTEGYHLVVGTLRTLIQQIGAPPYLPRIGSLFGGALVDLDFESQEGTFIATTRGGLGDEGDTSKPRAETIGFALTIPHVALAEGALEKLPLVVYGPGTGGSEMDVVASGIATDLTRQGFAVLSTTPVMRGTRAHSENIDSSLLDELKLLDTLSGTDYRGQFVSLVESGELFFNPLNLRAAVGNSQQAAVDYAWLGRVFSELTVDIQFSSGASSVGFDSEHIYFFGHSQGGSTGPLLSASPHYRAAVLSGAAGYLPTALLHKTEPKNDLSLSQILNYLVCDDPAEPLDETHPFMNLLGQLLEPADAELYMRDFVSGPEPKHLMMIVGQDDHYVSPLAHHANTAAGRLHQSTAPMGVSPHDVPAQELLQILYPDAGYGKTYSGLQGNVQHVTAGFRQYHNPTACVDDHFVFTCDPIARADLESFLGSALRQQLPTIP